MVSAFRYSKYMNNFIYSQLLNLSFSSVSCPFIILSSLRQLHVRRARLEESMQRKLLTTLNSVLLVVTITYITRAVFVLDLFLEFSGALTYSYFIWIVCTHWMPHLLGKTTFGPAMNRYYLRFVPWSLCRLFVLVLSDEQSGQ